MISDKTARYMAYILPKLNIFNLYIEYLVMLTIKW